MNFSFKIWRFLAVAWIGLVIAYTYWSSEPWAGGGNWGIPFAIVVFGILPALALLPVFLLGGWLASLYKRNRARKSGTDGS